MNQDMTQSDKELMFNNFVFFTPSKPILIFRSIMLILVGLSLICVPLLSGITLTMVFGIILCINGIAALFSAFRTPSGMLKSTILLYSIMIIIMGVWAAFFPLMMDFMFMFFIAFWMFFDGIGSLIIMFKKGNHSRIRSFLSGALSIIVGFLFILWPLSGVQAMNWLLGIIILTYGIIFLTNVIQSKKDEKNN